jgi:hypothetical protein
LETQTAASHGESEPVDAAGQPPTPAELAGCFPDLEILDLVGRGGMGVVYKARQRRLDRLVALKILSPTIGRDPAFAARFAREARAMAMLNHPHVVAVYDSGQAAFSRAGEGAGATATGGETSLYYFLMEFVDGVSLRRLLDTARLAPREALAIVPQICDALQYAHDMGVVHRDIKPENILLDKQGQVKIADFGIAKLVGLDAQDLALTGAGQVIGTPHYMAPEQTEHPQAVDHRADIYSLGVVFYQMLTGELPLGRFAPPSQKVQIDVRLDEVVLRALEKEPQRRYQQASQVKSQLETIAATPGSEAAGPSGIATAADMAIATLRWTARVFGMVMFLLFAMFFFGERSMDAPAMPFAKAGAGERIEWVGLSLMVFGYLIGWQWEGLAALCILVGAMEFHLVEWRFYMGPLDLPLIVGLLYGLCWWLERRCPQAGNRRLRDALGGPMVRTCNGLQRLWLREYRSPTTLFGWPLFHITSGLDPTTGRPASARGIVAVSDGKAVGLIAMGGQAIGGLAIGGMAVGVVAMGGLSIGVVAMGGLSLALAVAFGGGAVSLLFALGGGAIAPLACGGGAIGYYAMGGGATGVHAFGGNVQDLSAFPLFQFLCTDVQHWMLRLTALIGPILAVVAILQIASRCLLRPGRSTGDRWPPATGPAQAGPAQAGPGAIILLVGSVLLVSFLLGGALTLPIYLATQLAEMPAAAAARIEPTRPMIRQVIIDHGRAWITGFGAKDTRLVFRIGEASGWGCRFPNDTPFAAVVGLTGGGISCFASDPAGHRLLSLIDGYYFSFGAVTFDARRFVLADAAPKPDPGGAFRVGQYRPETGPPLPLTVRLEMPGKTSELPDQLPRDGRALKPI